MKIKRAVNWFLIVGVAVIAGACKPEPKAERNPPPATSRFEPGQAWTFNAPANELPSARLTVMRVDSDPKLGPIIHIMVTGVRHTLWESTNMFYSFTERALDRSVISLTETNVNLPDTVVHDFDETYEIAQRKMKAGEMAAGFDITVAEVLQALHKLPKHKLNDP